MATKPLTIVITCCAGVLALAIGWVAGDDLFSHTESDDVEKTAESVSVLVKALPLPNRETKQDKTGIQEKVDAGLRGALPYAENPSSDGLGLRVEPSMMPPPMEPITPLKGAKPSRAYLNDTQIAGIKQRLKLTKAQEKYWVPLEAALRGVVNQITDYQARVKISRAVSFDIASPEIQQLKTTAIPFLAQLRDDQKSQIKMLANMAGLGPIVTPFIEPQVAKNESKGDSKTTAKPDATPDAESDN